MAAELKNDKGTVTISNEVIAKIAGYTATNCYGVVGMSIRTGRDGLASLLKKESMDKGIKVKVSGDTVDIAMYVIMQYGVNVGTVGDIIKSNVKYHVEEATGLKVGTVTVNVESIRVSK